MEIGQLSECLDHLPNQGLSLSQVEAIRVSCSLRLLQNQMKSESIYFLGKILATHEDYYIAFSTELNKYLPSIYYCSQDATTWYSLAGIDKETRNEVIQIQAPLTGSLISEFTLPSGRIVNEELRLAAIVSDIAEHCLLIPRGYLLHTALDFVLLNPMWTGIQYDQVKMSDFRYWRQRESDMSLLEKAMSNPALDFLEPVEDFSEWSFVFSGESDNIQIRSLKWPGFVFNWQNDHFSNMYFGQGIAIPNLTEFISQRTEHKDAHKNIQ
ncbi:nucleoside diphosphate kinase [Tritrichomonas foetus]|uniref:Radial spoke head protein 9 homolog n=1 Tax=Tritrichomonas foetus TaxID=1144522 RepID=A0A1J4KN91_9EUKA|nr:nucleoside diphosphate kinase [Tritrichomonas foetus]|eukprot:OHT12783.1 nucleoside diphosphate kinase [Tritrichomonas foetus]